MTEIAVEVEAESWTAALPDVVELCRNVAAAALAAGAARVGLTEHAGRMEVSVLLADDERVRELNRDWRGFDKPTNVLSFAALEDEDVPAEGPILLGDVIVAFQTTAAEAAESGKTITNHLSHLIVHGVLHLLGYDHEEDDEAEAMERLEAAVLGALGIPDPYADGDMDVRG